jgi:hypothetical protein
MSLACSEKKKWLTEPFWGFCHWVKRGTPKMVLPDRGFGEKLAKPFLTFLQKMVLSHKKGFFNGFLRNHT